MNNYKNITFANLIKAYREAAAIEYDNTRSPVASTVRNIVQTLERLLEYCGIGLGSLVKTLNNEMLSKYVTARIQGGVRTISLKTEMQHLNALFAPWTRPHYARLLGIEHPVGRAFDVPNIKVPPTRYNPPDGVLVARVKAWYGELTRICEEEIVSGQRVPDSAMRWMTATLMLEFAVRNGDALRMKWSNLVERGGRIMLRYTPHKTSKSSGRVVCWPVNNEILHLFNVIREKSQSEHMLGDSGSRCLTYVSREMRRIGFKGTKSAYELRKICIDHVYQHCGAEMATSISGDDIRTILKYYADPSTPNMGDTRIFDLL